MVYGVGALMSAAAPGLGVLILGNSILEGVGTALLIPPVYILTTLLFTDLTSRARAFGVISALGGIGAAAGPLIGGLITSAISWRAAFVFQALIIAVIVLLSRKIQDPLPAGSLPLLRHQRCGPVRCRPRAPRHGHPGRGQQPLADAHPDRWPAWLVLALFFVIGAQAKERAGQEPLLSTSLFRNRTSNLGLITQNAQWLMLMGVSFVVSAYLQVVRGYDAIQTGVIFTAATVGLLVSLPRRRTARATLRPADADPGRLCYHDGRHRSPVDHGQWVDDAVGVRSGAAADRTRAGHDADPIGEPRPVQLPRRAAR